MGLVWCGGVATCCLLSYSHPLGQMTRAISPTVCHPFPTLFGFEWFLLVKEWLHFTPQQPRLARWKISQKDLCTVQGLLEVDG